MRIPDSGLSGDLVMTWRRNDAGRTAEKYTRWLNNLAGCGFASPGLGQAWVAIPVPSKEIHHLTQPRSQNPIGAALSPQSRGHRPGTPLPLAPTTAIGKLLFPITLGYSSTPVVSAAAIWPEIRCEGPLSLPALIMSRWIDQSSR